MSRRLLVIASAVLLPMTFATAALAQEIAWIDRFGGPDFDTGNAVAADAGGVYVVGATYAGTGPIPGQTAFGAQDAFIRKVSVTGVPLWTRQFGTASFDYGEAVALSGDAVFVAGTTQGALPGQTLSGSGDGFIRRYDADGSEEWTRQFGSTGYDAASGLAADDTGVYVAGVTTGVLPGASSAGANDAFVVKFALDGSWLWTRQFGTSGQDGATAIAAGSDGVYVVGGTGSPSVCSCTFNNAFIRKITSDGSDVWSETFGSDTDDIANDVAIAESGVFVVGQTFGALPGQANAGFQDAFLTRFGFEGNQVWARQFGTSADDVGWGAAAYADRAYITGVTGGALPNQTNHGFDDVFVRSYGGDGTELWTHQFGSSSFETGRAAVAVGDAVYVAGDGVVFGRVTFPTTLPDAFVARILLEPPDTTPPTLILPGDITVDGLTQAGAPVTFTASAEDAVDGPVPITCTPPSGSTFPLGATEVRCVASDAAGNSSAGAFTVYVKDAAWQLEDLRAAILEYGGSGSSLDDKVVTIQRFVAAGKLEQACRNLVSFDASVEAQAGKSLTNDEALDLLSRTDRIESVIGC